MFHNILKVFQDGLILTEGEEIVYANSAVRKVYDLCVEDDGADEKDTRCEEREKATMKEEGIKKAI
jgi:hypothetical protein